jgi:SAM-dependent methyltransferase
MNDAGSERAARGYWDSVYARDARPPRDAGRGESVTDPVWQAAVGFLGDLAGRRVLDLGCGDGRASLYLAAQGARVTAVDRSPVAIESLIRTAAAAAVPESELRAVVADAFDIARLGPFDAVFGSMILHHLEPFDRFAQALRDAMVPGARAFFYENNADSRVLMWCRDHLTGRFGIPRYGDVVERPLGSGELDILRASFSVGIEYPQLVLFRLAPVYLLRGRGWRVCGWIDDRLFAVTAVRRHSYRQCVLLTRRDD